SAGLLFAGEGRGRYQGGAVGGTETVSMRHGFSAFVSVAMAVACIGTPALAQTFASTGKPLQAVYEHLHRNPELSFQESKSSAILAAEMKALGFEVTQGVGAVWVKSRAMADYGKLEAGVGGYGLVAVMRNGAGPTLMIRTDMDALPVVERTELPFASKARDVSWSGDEGGVMHACGHDIHMTVWLGTARELVRQKSEWKGTLVMIAQPAEELGLGAIAMLDDGLFERFPRPDYNLALHVNANLPAGMVGHGSGFVMANVDTVDLLVNGKGGHGAYPQDTKDPVVLAARIVGALQTLVSREIDALDAGVVTVGSISGGRTHNVIPDEVLLKITVRSYEDATREKLLKGIERIARGEAMAAGIEGNLAPKMTVKTDYTPSTYNEPELAARLARALETRLGAERLIVATPSMVGEDFSRFGRTEPKIPSAIFWLGSVAQAAYDASLKPGAPPLPGLHSSTYAPDPDPTIATGVEAMTAAAIDLLRRSF
ncbi:MAG: amidohydrolase, partial [Alphaproteobacteria bacterium]|nr:amidohydrolase [Alphaproteobacteria bacterium]